MQASAQPKPVLNLFHPQYFIKIGPVPVEGPKQVPKELTFESYFYILRELNPGTPERGALSPCPVIKGATGAAVPFYENIVSNFMVYQDRIETNLLQLFAHLETSDWFSIISGIISEANILDEQKQA